VSGDLGGLTLTAGVYHATSSLGLTGTVTLDAQGDPSAVFIFQVASTLTTASNSSVALINGAQSCNVFWQIGSSATLGTNTVFRGNILALTSITANTATSIDGRALASNGAVTLDTNTVTRPTCSTQPTATSTTLTSSHNPSRSGQPVTFTATVTPTSGSATPTGAVQFKDGSTVLGTRDLNAAGNAVFTTSSLGVGRHTITAVYLGTPGFGESTSIPLHQRVTRMITSPHSAHPTPSDVGRLAETGVSLLIPAVGTVILLLGGTVLASIRLTRRR
jgi:ice-binding like protein/Big-like domain-containing protein